MLFSLIVARVTTCPIAHVRGSTSVIMIFRFLISSLLLLVLTVAPPGFAQNNEQWLVNATMPHQTKEKGYGNPVVCAANYTLPSMDSGGLVVFFHVPKTGGSTIRRNLESVEGINYVFNKNYSQYTDSAYMVEDMISEGVRNNSVLFYEIHASTSPSFFGMRRRLERWRETAFRNGVPVFYFSVLREPISYSFSHFNFFHLQKRNPSFERCSATEHDFLRKSVHNPQCQFLYKGEQSKWIQQTHDRAREVMVDSQDCNAIEEKLFELMDWVGTTEGLTRETVPMLQKILDMPETVWPSYRVSKELRGYTPFGKEDVSLNALEKISEMSSLDTKLYQNVKNHYQYEDVILKFK